MKIKLYDIFKERWLSAFDDIVFYSDPHFGDIDVNKHFRYPKNFENLYNPYNPDPADYMTEVEAVELIDKEQLAKINSKCGKKTCIIVLGDVGDVEYIKKIKAGYKVLIMGNHDKGASNYKRDYEKVEITQDDINHQLPGVEILEKAVDNHLFDEVYEGPLFISDKIVLSHEPIYVPFALNIHGHDHAVDKNGPFTTKRTFIEYDKDGNEVKTTRDGYWYNCCAESIDYTPVRLTEIVEGKLGKIDSIHRETIDNAIERKSKRSR